MGKETAREDSELRPTAKPARSRAASEEIDTPPRQPSWSSFAGEGISGAEVFAGICKEEHLAALFCAPGNYSITHAVAGSGIPSYGGRTEGGMCSAADGFYRASGEVAA